LPDNARASLAALMSARICAARASTEGKRRSSRRRATNSTPSLSP